MALPAALLIASTFMQARANRESTNAQYQSGMYNANLAEQNAALADWQALDTMKQAAVNVENQRRYGKQMIGESRAAMGASGFKVDSGTNAILQDQQNRDLEYDLQTILNNADKQRWSYEQQADAYRTEAGMQRSAAKNALSSGKWALGATVLGGLANLYGMYGGLGGSGGVNTGQTPGNLSPRYTQWGH